jgi:hypothetical protein
MAGHLEMVAIAAGIRAGLQAVTAAHLADTVGPPEGVAIVVAVAEVIEAAVAAEAAAEGIHPAAVAILPAEAADRTAARI